ncbi:MAG: OsmC family protein [Betaproteobacteria bacterium]
MHRYEARVAWNRNGATFTDNKYSRGHEWHFDGGVTVPASSSPSIVPTPWSVAAAVDPEEALVASASSCHMLFFLALSVKRGFVVESYVDDAFAVMEKNPGGKLVVTRVTLRPTIVFGGGQRPSAEEIDSIHHMAHEECFIANSIKSEVVVEAGVR